MSPKLRRAIFWYGLPALLGGCSITPRMQPPSTPQPIVHLADSTNVAVDRLLATVNEAIEIDTQLIVCEPKPSGDSSGPSKLATVVGDLAAEHLTQRGYTVVAPDHSSRNDTAIHVLAVTTSAWRGTTYVNFWLQKDSRSGQLLAATHVELPTRLVGR